MAHPSWSETLASFDPTNGGRIACQQRKTNIRSVRLGCRPKGRPAFVISTERVHRRSGDRCGMIVLDHEHIREPAQRRSESGGTRRRDRTPIRILGAGRHDHSRGTPLESRVERVRTRPLVIDRHWYGHETERPDQVDHRWVSGILDRHAITTAEVRLKHTLDSVESAGHDREVIDRHAVGGEKPGTVLCEALVDRSVTVENGRSTRRSQHAARVRQQARIRVARGQIPQSFPNLRIGRKHHRRSVGDERSHTAPSDGDPSLAQASICGRHGIRRQIEFCGQNPDGRQAVAGEEFVIGDSPFDVNRQFDGTPASHFGSSVVHSTHYNILIVAVQSRNEWNRPMSATDVPSSQSSRTTVKRSPHRARYDRETVNAIFDEAMICHVAFIADGSPFVIPTIHARVGDVLYFHGSPATRMMRLMKKGAEVCVTATLVDSIVAARSVFNHSLGYRSAMVIGPSRLVDSPEEHTLALEAITDAVLPGRWAEARLPSRNENKGTLVAAVPIEEFSAKVRGSEVNDEEEDYALPVWAGSIPLSTVIGAAEPDPRLAEGIEIPESVRRFVAGE